MRQFLPTSLLLPDPLRRGKREREREDEGRGSPTAQEGGGGGCAKEVEARGLSSFHRRPYPPSPTDRRENTHARCPLYNTTTTAERRGRLRRMRLRRLRTEGSSDLVASFPSEQLKVPFLPSALKPSPSVPQCAQRREKVRKRKKEEGDPRLSGGGGREREACLFGAEKAAALFPLFHYAPLLCSHESRIANGGGFRTVRSSCWAGVHTYSRGEKEGVAQFCSGGA